MSASVEEIRRVAIALIAPALVPDPDALARLDGADWQRLIAIARSHRVLPLMHARLRADGAHWPVPADLNSAAADSFRKHSLKVILARRRMVQAVVVLAGQGIEAIALKGSYLAFHAYVEAGLRPLRDVDLLVAPADAQTAWQALRAAGWQPLFDAIGTLEEYQRIKHQLPGLMCSDGKVMLEIHHRALHGSGSDPDLTDDPEFVPSLQRTAINGTRLSYMGPEFLLAHLIIHSAHDHMFDNGPGIFADIAALLATHRIDWPRFWAIAERFDAVRSAILVLRIAELWWAIPGIEWGQHAAAAAAVPRQLVETVAQLSLRDRASATESALLSRLDSAAGVGAKLALVARKLFPRPSLLRAAYPNSGRPSELPGLYWRKWRDLAGRRLGAYAASMVSADGHADRRRLAQLAGWVRADAILGDGG